MISTAKIKDKEWSVRPPRPWRAGGKPFKKDEKVNLMHIAICRLLEPYGFYEFDFVDKDGWPHYKIKEELPPLKAGEQSVLMKEAIVNYFLEKEVIE